MINEIEHKISICKTIIKSFPEGSYAQEFAKLKLAYFECSLEIIKEIKKDFSRLTRFIKC